jgi:heptaprenyl diphosphate synthase
VEGTTVSRLDGELDLRDSIAQLTESAPSAVLRDAATAAAAGVEGALGPLIVADAGEIGLPAALPVALLEAAERAEGVVHGLGGRGAHERVTGIEDNRAGALAAAWLRARATELSAELGEAALLRFVEALGQISDGHMREAEDLYDGGRPAERYLEATEAIRGSLGAFAAALAIDGGASENEVEELAAAGGRLATAARISDDVRAMVPELVPGGVLAGESLARGVYTLPAIYALEDDPKLASSLGGAIPPDALEEVVSRIRATGALSRCAVTCRRLTGDAGRLSELGTEIAEACEEAGRA